MPKLRRTTRRSTPSSNGSRPRGRPNLGLVCVSYSEECRFRTITRTNYLALPEQRRPDALLRIYWENLGRLHWALTFCRRQGISLYRATSALFPMSDEEVGTQVLKSIAANLSSFGRRAERLGIRVVLHPDQFVVLNSESPAVAATSVRIMEKHARAFDLLGLPRSTWSAMILHGGKSGRSDQLVEVIRALPESVKSRLVVENDEYAFAAAEILDICRRAGVPMVFDAHHHVIKEKLDSYEHPSVARMTRAARSTWPNPRWQIVHLSNGNTSFADRNHSEFITSVPSAYASVHWIEVEARGKERAIARLCEEWCVAGRSAIKREVPTAS